MQTIKKFQTIEIYKQIMMKIYKLKKYLNIKINRILANIKITKHAKREGYCCII